jgi:uncharacterized SAM-binding protein YcdF (DUF218 family)
MTYQQPLLLVFLIIAAIGLLRTPRSRGRTVAMVGVGGIFMVSWPPIEWVFSRPLAGQYPERPFRPETMPQAIVVLAEAVQPPLFGDRYPLPSENLYRRCRYAAWICRRYGPLPILVSGGGEDSRAYPPMSATMREALRLDGIPESMIWTEERSHSTHENAEYSATILREHGVSRIALVVDAASMPRAAACFRKLQFEVMPAPSSFHGWGEWQEEMLPSWRAIRRNEVTLHEAVGILWYRIRGWI